MDVELKIQRFDPEKDTAPHWETYRVPVEPMDRVLDVLLPPPKDFGEASPQRQQESGAARQVFRKQLREGKLDDKEIELKLSGPSAAGVQLMGPPGMEEMTQQLQSMFANLGQDKTRTRKLKIRDAMKLLGNPALAIAQVAEAMGWPNIIGLGEMMNFPGVLFRDPDVVEDDAKIVAANVDHDERPLLCSVWVTARSIGRSP